jgi:hypothetical protein
MTIKVSKPAINIREELADLKQDTGLKGQELMRADTAQEARTAISAGRKNMIINGAMQVAQRGTSITVTGSQIYTLDRWSMRCDATTVTATQSTDSPTGFATSLKLTNGTGSSGSGTDSCYIRQNFEGYNTNHLEIGTANAKTVTLSFWVKSSITGTYIVSFLDSGQDNGYPASYTISTANTWEKKTITLTLSDYGSWVGSSTTDKNLVVHFDFGSGSNRDLPNLNAWNDGEVNDYSHSSQTDWVGTTGSTLYLTGVQLEVGSIATEFEHRSYGEELALCQRYYQRFVSDASYTAFGVVRAADSTNCKGVLTYRTTMRASPTFAQSNTGVNVGPQSAVTSIGTTYAGKDCAWVDLTSSGASLTAGQAVVWNANNNAAAYVELNSEL